MIKISVILPCYNVGKYIAKCLDSLVNQTLADIEIICVDDKSTDDTVSIIKTYKDKRIKLVSHKKNMGAGASRNDGLKIATGEYISFIDPDDYVDLDFLEKLYSAAKSKKSDIAKSCLRYTNTKEKYSLNNLIQQDIAYFSGEYTTAIYKRSFLNKHKISFPVDIITGQDSVFLTHVVINNPSIALIDDTSYWYNRHEGSLDSPILSHAKILSRYNMIMRKIELIQNAKLTNEKFGLFMKTQVLVHIYSVVNYQYEQEEDKNIFWDCLHDIYNKYGIKKEIQSVFGKQIISCLESKNIYQKCDFYICRTKKRIDMFFFIPFLFVYTSKTCSLIKLFDFLPLLKISRNKINRAKYYLFGFIPLLKIKG